MNIENPHAVILHGASSQDLTRFSWALADFYGCDHVVDHFTPLRSPLVPRGLHLATCAPEPGSFAPDILIIPVVEAIASTLAFGFNQL